MKCPCCGQSVTRKNGALVLFDQLLTAARDDTQVQLTPQQFAILNALKHCRLTRDQLVSLVYPDANGGPDFARSVIATQITRLNKRIAALGFQVRAETPGARFAPYEIRNVAG